MNHMWFSFRVDYIQVPLGSSVLLRDLFLIIVLKNGQICEFGDFLKAGRVRWQIDNKNRYIRERVGICFPVCIKSRNLRLAMRSTGLRPIQDENPAKVVLEFDFLVKGEGCWVLID